MEGKRVSVRNRPGSTEPHRVDYEFGERLCRRLLADAEFAFVKTAASLYTERIGTRFRVKEATLKALRLADVGVSWKEIGRRSEWSSRRRTPAA
jgi:phosphopantetheinyl transferase (holo-ACP synthase)